MCLKTNKVPIEIFDRWQVIDPLQRHQLLALASVLHHLHIEQRLQRGLQLLLPGLDVLGRFWWQTRYIFRRIWPFSLLSKQMMTSHNFNILWSWAMWPYWAIYWTLGNFLKPASLSLFLVVSKQLFVIKWLMKFADGWIRTQAIWCHNIA